MTLRRITRRGERRRAAPVNRNLKRRKLGVNVSFVAPDLDKTLPSHIRRLLEFERNEWQIERIRRYFLKALTTLAPEVMDSLQRLHRRYAAAHGAVPDRAVLRWASRWRLNVPWFILTAKRTLAEWQLLSRTRRPRVWAYDGVEEGMLVPEDEDPPAQAPELLIRAEHFEWLIRSRVLAQSHHQITPHPDHDYSTLRHAVQKLERRLDLAVQQNPRRVQRNP